MKAKKIFPNSKALLNKIIYETLKIIVDCTREVLEMGTLSLDFKRKVADLYIKNKEKLEKFDPKTMKSFATETLEIINNEKMKSEALHDLELLEYNMGLLKNYSAALRHYELDTDEYDFTRNDCKNIVDSTKKWLTLERLI
jgi:hypothetical protein